MNKFSSLPVALLLIIAGIFCLTNCEKDYSFEGGPSGASSGTAKFYFISTATQCDSSLVKGNYYVGNALGATNIVELKANVTVAGSYSLTTVSTNGMQFTSAGSFTNTGLQTVIFQGIGNPIVEGNYSFRTPDSTACLFTVPVTKVPVAIASFTLAGAPLQCENAKVIGEYTAGRSVDISNAVTLMVDVTAIGAYKLTTDTVNDFYFSGAGQFTALGNQQITLLATGTPRTADYVTFTPAITNANCTFNLIVANPQPLATYVLQSSFGTPAPCMYAVSGNYGADTALTSANTVGISVYVTIAGNFTIATPTVNGMKFSYSGKFATTGSQTITLVGQGKPIAAGTFSFMPTIIGPSPLGGESCGFSIVVN